MKGQIAEERETTAGGDTGKKKPSLRHWKIVAMYLRLYDIIAVNFAYFLGLWLRFDLRFSAIPTEYWAAFLKFAPLYTAAVLLVFQRLQLYHSLWRFASFRELNRILAASVITTAAHVIGITAMFGRMPVSYYIIGAITQAVFVVMVRFSYRYVTLERTRREQNLKATHRAMVVGAGAAGQVLLREMNNSNQSVAKPVCVIDDNVNTWHRLLEGVPIVGGRESIAAAVKKYRIDQILFAIPTASAADKRDILELCKETGCELKILPGIYQLAKGEVALSKLKPVAVEDLLGREPVQVNLEGIFQSLQGKTILVTGGGGSIGSELCRQIAGHAPKRLILFDIYENNAYDIEQELRRKYPDLALTVLIGSVRDGKRMREVFAQYRPEIVYHAAAHKHVPLMEASPKEAVKNNVVGTYQTACAALKYGAQRFVLISTDKAINPTNIMGASKRVCEMLIQAMDAVSKTGRWDLLPRLSDVVEMPGIADIAGNFSAEGGGKTSAAAIASAMVADGAEDCTQAPVTAKTMAEQLSVSAYISAQKQNGIEMECVKNKDRSGTQFVAVRFGNVLGSNGSVIPLFRKQIEAGGPVTVTHPEVIRYFMTIPEAVSLVLQAGTYAWGGEIFVLDMGVPVKIDTLARNLIQLSGYKPDEDIKIVYTGLRPGEKLYEETLMEEEGLKTTDDELIHIAKPIPFNIETFFRQLSELTKLCYEGEGSEVAAMVAEITGTYQPAETCQSVEIYQSAETKALEAEQTFSERGALLHPSGSGSAAQEQAASQRSTEAATEYPSQSSAAAVDCAKEHKERQRFKEKSRFRNTAAEQRTPKRAERSPEQEGTVVELQPAGSVKAAVSE